MKIRNIFLNKEIISKEGILHFRRWTVFSCYYFSIYIHQIFKADEDLHLHNHPWNYCSIILYGSYIERNQFYDTIMKPLSVSIQKAQRFHKIKEMLSKQCISLFITGKKYNEWGYDTENGFIDHKTYRQLKNKKAI